MKITLQRILLRGVALCLCFVLGWLSCRHLASPEACTSGHTAEVTLAVPIVVSEEHFLGVLQEATGLDFEEDLRWTSGGLLDFCSLAPVWFIRASEVSVAVGEWVIGVSEGSDTSMCDGRVRLCSTHYVTSGSGRDDTESHDIHVWALRR